jgi:integral membrane protein
MLNSPIGRLRIVAMLEGLSFLVLLFVAMPMKYMGGNPDPVRTVGLIHGVLFILFGFLLAGAAAKHEWPFKIIFHTALAALIPFGTFVYDKKLKALDV